MFTTDAYIEELRAELRGTSSVVEARKIEAELEKALQVRAMLTEAFEAAIAASNKHN